VLTSSVVQEVSSDADHPGDLGALGHIVQSPPGDHEDLFNEVVDVCVRQRVGVSCEKSHDSGRGSARQVS
jgi:hypothetical protein